ncbi:hypothetical protein FDECE_8006 [Fusarium decemcellulare]|nr:hypothetical protein FDECE_8006 [Fusarium decemcellulare]
MSLPSFLSLLRNKTEFKYDLQLDCDTIRLVRFRRPQKLGMLSLELSTHSLSEAETLGYHALSYTWCPPEGNGDYTSSDFKSIFVDGKKFLAGRNLYDVLIRLREFAFAEYYWIDAICIDQTNETEKGVQVSNMNHIYTTATRVNIWVGKSTKDSPQAVNLICKLATLHQQHAAEFNVRTLGLERIDRKMTKFGLPARDSSDWAPVAAFFHRNWFKRSWTIQEVAMAGWAVFIWGEHKMTWEVIRDSISMMQRLILHPKPAKTKEKRTRNDDSMSILYGPSMIIKVRHLFNNDDGFERQLLPHIQGLTGIDAWTKTASPMLAFLLMQCRKFKAKDQRDKVYSLLGMANSAAVHRGAPKSTIKVDYGSTTAAVFDAATRTIIEEYNHLGFISIASLVMHDGSEDLELTPGLPSGYPISRLPPPLWRLYHELGPLSFRILGPQLHVKGIRIGTLSAGSTLIQHLRSHGFEPFASLLLRCGQRYEPTGELSVEAFWRTLICGIDPNDSADQGNVLSSGPDLRRPFRAWLSGCILNVVWESNPSGVDRVPDDQRENYEALIRRDGDEAGDLLPGLAWLDDKLSRLSRLESSNRSSDFEAQFQLATELETNNRLCSRYETLVHVWVTGRRFFVTDEGHMGMGVTSVTEGDDVWVLSSCPVPLILRARADGSYQLIGDSSVHGVMFGEAVDGGEWEEICIT